MCLYKKSRLLNLLSVQVHGARDALVYDIHDGRGVDVVHGCRPLDEAADAEEDLRGIDVYGHALANRVHAEVSVEVRAVHETFGTLEFVEHPLKSQQLCVRHVLVRYADANVVIERTESGCGEGEGQRTFESDIGKAHDGVGAVVANGLDALQDRLLDCVRGEEGLVNEQAGHECESDAVANDVDNKKQ